MSRIGVTGSEGYIGSRLCENLKGEIPSVDIENGEDVVDPKTLQENFSQTDSVVHLAAISGVEDCRKNPTEAVRTNIRGTVEVAKFCRDYDKRLVFSSSFATERHNLYGETKRTAERAIQEICDNYLIFKMSNVYGGDKDTVVNIFIDKWVEDEPLPVHEPGFQVRDFIHISDVVDAYVKAAESSYVGKLDLVSGNVISINKLADLISEEKKIVDRDIHDEIYSLETSTDGLQKIKFQPSISIEEGIEKEKRCKKP